jgi:hypothetical protein
LLILLSILLEAAFGMLLEMAHLSVSGLMCGSDWLLFKMPFQDCFMSPVLGMQQWQIQGNEFKEIGSGP